MKFVFPLIACLLPVSSAFAVQMECVGLDRSEERVVVEVTDRYQPIGTVDGAEISLVKKSSFYGMQIRKGSNYTAFLSPEGDLTYMSQRGSHGIRFFLSCQKI